MGEGIAAARGSRPRWSTALIVTGVAVAAVAITAGVLWFTVAPGALANLTTHVAETDETATVGAVTVPVPAGWATQHPPFDDHTLLLLSPDRDLRVTVTVADLAPAAAFAATAPDDAGPITELLRAGTQAVHDQTSADTLVAAVGAAGQTPAAVLVARASTGDVTTYAASIAQILDGTAVTP